MSRFLISKNVPYDIVHLMEDWEILANAIVLAQLDNGQEWSWEAMEFIEKR
jgi:hypothetical protein